VTIGLAGRLVLAAAMLPPILFLLWIIFVDIRSPIADIRELDLLNDSELRLQGIVSKLLPAEVVLYRASSVRGRSPCSYWASSSACAAVTIRGSADMDRPSSIVDRPSSIVLSGC